jgi:hypothetical protein
MAALKVFGITTVGLFVLVGMVGVIKKNTAHKTQETVLLNVQEEVRTPTPDVPAFAVETITYAPVPVTKETQVIQQEPVSENTRPAEVDRISRLFTTAANKLPFVETVSYKSRVGWLQGRPAWIADYASYYATSRHFIARSLNGNRDYYTQKVSSGDLFNVFRKDKNLRFHLVVDLTQLKMWFYAYDADMNIRYLLKTYRVGCGKPDKDASSGCLTPLGTFMLGDKVAIYKPGVEGFFKDQKIEMIQVFGTRWLPYKGEQDETVAMIKGFGMHGSPWAFDEMKGELVEKRESIGTYDSSGCIRLLQEDIEEIFAIVITKPTTVHVVKNFSEVKLPGSEWIDPVATDNFGG